MMVTQWLLIDFNDVNDREVHLFWEAVSARAVLPWKEGGKAEGVELGNSEVSSRDISRAKVKPQPTRQGIGIIATVVFHSSTWPSTCHPFSHLLLLAVQQAHCYTKGFLKIGDPRSYVLLMITMWRFGGISMVWNTTTWWSQIMDNPPGIAWFYHGLEPVQRDVCAEWREVALSCTWCPSQGQGPHGSAAVASGNGSWWMADE